MTKRELSKGLTPPPGRAGRRSADPACNSHRRAAQSAPGAPRHRAGSADPRAGGATADRPDRPTPPPRSAHPWARVHSPHGRTHSPYGVRHLHGRATYRPTLPTVISHDSESITTCSLYTGHYGRTRRLPWLPRRLQDRGRFSGKFGSPWKWPRPTPRVDTAPKWRCLATP